MGAWSYYIVVHWTYCGRFQKSDCKESHLGKPYSVGHGQRNRNCDYASCMNKNDILGMLVYFLTAVIFGGGAALVLLAVHEDNDRCHYYNGNWNKGDLLSGVLAITVGMALRYLLCANSGICSVIEMIA